MVSQHGVDTDKLHTLLAHGKAAQSYTSWLDDFIVPLLKRIGLKVKVKKTAGSYVITVKLPGAVQNG